MGALYFYNRNLSRSLCLKNIKQVGHAFLSEMHFVIIDDETGNAHDIIFLFKAWIVLEIIDVGRYIFIIRGNTLRRRYKVGAHCAGKRYGNLHMERLADAFDAFLQCFTHCLLYTSPSPRD